MRINLLGGAGTGKTTMAAWLFSEMKSLGYSVELALEYVKTWAYLDRKVQMFDQVSLLGNQMQREYLPLSCNVDHVVTDSPLFLCYAYATYEFDEEFGEAIYSIIEKFDNRFKSLNFLVKREVKYNPHGRYYNESSSVEFDELLVRLLDKKSIPYHVVAPSDRESLFDIVTKSL